MSKLRLFCLPYAGGSAMAYIRWKEHLHPEIELCPVELAGRGTRVHEPFYVSFEEMTTDIYQQIRGRLDDKPYAIFGHSMGAWSAFEVAHQIQASGDHPLPLHLFVSARRAPQVQKDDVAYHELGMSDLRTELQKLGGTPDELFENKDFMMSFVPVLLSDFKITYHYRYAARSEKLNCALSVLSGKGDTVITGADLLAWKEHSAVGCRIYKPDGGHFFIQEQTAAVVEIVNTTLADHL